MRKILISDSTLKRSASYRALPFKLKIEIAKMLDNLGVSVIETAGIPDDKTEYFLTKSLSSAMKSGILAVPVDIMDPQSIDRTWEAVKVAANPRLQVEVPMSTVQMEYFCHKKPAGILQLISENVAACAALCKDVEYVACDFTRADEEFLLQGIDEAIKAGATTVTLSDAAGDLLPAEFAALVSKVKTHLPENILLGVQCSNDIFLADSCSIAAVQAGADEIKVSMYGKTTASLEHFPVMLNAKSSLCKASCAIDLTLLGHSLNAIKKLREDAKGRPATCSGIPTSEESDASFKLTSNDDAATILKIVADMGYQLSAEDGAKVCDAVAALAASNGFVERKELDAIVASVAFQVPETYTLESFVINSGNTISATCHIRLHKGEELLDYVGIGDGPIDAAFLAIEKVVGRNYELDDFQIRALTEGRKAMGETIVRLRHDGKIYSGRGVSTDIIASSVSAYLNAVNKIAYEEEPF